MWHLISRWHCIHVTTQLLFGPSAPPQVVASLLNKLTLLASNIANASELGTYCKTLFFLLLFFSQTGNNRVWIKTLCGSKIAKNSLILNRGFFVLFYCTSDSLWSVCYMHFIVVMSTDLEQPLQWVTSSERSAASSTHWWTRMMLSIFVTVKVHEYNKSLLVLLILSDLSSLWASLLVPTEDVKHLKKRHTKITNFTKKCFIKKNNVLGDFLKQLCTF